MAKLTTRGRNRIAKKNFAIKPKGKSKKPGAYPIHDRVHAINALARVSQHGSSEEKATVRAAVYAKYPDLEPEKKTKKKQ